MFFRFFLVVVFLVPSCFFTANVFASGSGSYRVETPDAAVMGMGSAFVGQADTPAAVYYNPAGINQIKRPEISIGDAIIAPRAQYKSPSDGTVQERNNEYNIPNFYAVIPVLTKLSVGIGSGSNWGLGTNWAPDGPLKYATTQANITDMDNSLVASYQVTDRWSLAASADNDYSKVDESRQFSNAGTASYDGGIEVKGNNDAWGYRLASLFKINDQNQVGLMYRSRIDHQYTGKISVNNISPYLQGAYGFTSSSFVGDIEEKSVLPQSVVIGYSFKPTKKWTINVDAEWMDWSSTKYQNLTIFNATSTQLGFLNTGNPTAENWHSAWSESIGIQYAVTDKFRVRSGYYHHDQVIANANFNPVIPDSASNACTAGFGYDVTPHLTLDIAYSGLFYATRNVTNTVASSTVNGKYDQFVNIGLVSMTYKF